MKRWTILVLVMTITMAGCAAFAGEPGSTAPVEPAASAAPAQTGAAEEPGAIPAELTGVWQGTGEQAGGGDLITLIILVREDATGMYSFFQGGYSESYPFTLVSDTETFSVDIPENNRLGIADCGGTYAYEDGTLTLHVVTTFSSGRQFRYIAECVKQPPYPKETEE